MNSNGTNIRGLAKNRRSIFSLKLLLFLFYNSLSSAYPIMIVPINVIIPMATPKNPIVKATVCQSPMNIISMAKIKGDTAVPIIPTTMFPDNALALFSSNISVIMAIAGGWNALAPNPNNANRSNR